MYKFLDPADIRRLKNYEFGAKAMVEGYLAGRHRSRQRGSSIEFHEFRQYTPGDDLARVDWRVFARNEHEELRPITWRAVLDDALEILRSKLRCCEIVDLVPADLPAVAGVAIPMEQVLINLLSNAVDAYANAAPGVPRTITVRGGCEDGAVTLRVEDRAGGIPAAALPRVFEPFFTTKPPGRGTGLGLALVFGTVVEMGGTITAANEDGGAVFEIRLPAVQASPDNSASAMPLSPPMA